MRIDEFLLARIAEDEALARGAIAERHAWTAFRLASVEPDFQSWIHDGGYVALGAERMLAECAAKRAVVDQFTAAMQWADEPDCTDPPAYRIMAGAVMDCLHALAAVYSDHPDYRPEWAA